MEQSLLEQVVGLPWKQYRLDAIDFEDPRPWWWVGTAPRPEELELLRMLEVEGRWIECRPDLHRDALQRVRVRLEGEIQ